MPFAPSFPSLGAGTVPGRGPLLARRSSSSASASALAAAARRDLKDSQERMASLQMMYAPSTTNTAIAMNTEGEGIAGEQRKR